MMPLNPVHIKVSHSFSLCPVVIHNQRENIIEIKQVQKLSMRISGGL